MADWRARGRFGGDGLFPVRAIGLMNKQPCPTNNLSCSTRDPWKCIENSEARIHGLVDQGRQSGDPEGSAPGIWRSGSGDACQIRLEQPGIQGEIKVQAREPEKTRRGSSGPKLRPRRGNGCENAEDPWPRSRSRTCVLTIILLH